MAIEVRTYSMPELSDHLLRLSAYVAAWEATVPLSRHPGWLLVLSQGLQHQVHCLEAIQGARTLGLLFLAHVRSPLFGRFLVSLPYLNYGGVLAEDDAAARMLVDGAVKLADRLQVRFLELRGENAVRHAALSEPMHTKVHMRLPLPADCEVLWKSLSDKVRNQVRKGEKHSLTFACGGAELLPDFYQVFSQNMRDLGTPVYGRSLFQSILRQFPTDAEVAVVRSSEESRPLAAALLLHGQGTTEVPSAGSLRSHRSTNANMFMYWHLLKRAVERQQHVFDFGRSTVESNTYRFKKQWGAQPFPAEWQYYLRHGSVSEMRPDSPKYRILIRTWQRLPVGVTQLLGPWIVRGIP